MQVHTVGKLNDSSLNKFPNVVQLWSNKSISDITSQLVVFYGAHNATELQTVVHILLDSFDEKLNFFEIQKQTKNIAKELRPSKIFFYIILLQKVSKYMLYTKR